MMAPVRQSDETWNGGTLSDGMSIDETLLHVTLADVLGRWMSSRAVASLEMPGFRRLRREVACPVPRPEE